MTILREQGDLALADQARARAAVGWPLANHPLAALGRVIAQVVDLAGRIE